MSFAHGTGNDTPKVVHVVDQSPVMCALAESQRLSLPGSSPGSRFVAGLYPCVIVALAIGDRIGLVRTEEAKANSSHQVSEGRD